MMLLHFLQRILKTLPWTLSSEIEYLAWQASQTIFISIPERVLRVGPPRPQQLGKIVTQLREWVVQPDGLAAVRPDGHQAERHARHALDRLDVGARRRREI